VAEEARYFLARSLFYLYLLAAFHRPIERGKRCDHEKGDSMRSGCERYHVCAYLVGHIAISRNSVGAHNNFVHNGTGAEKADMVVRYELYVDAFLVQFPRSETRTLQIGSRLSRYHPYPLADSCAAV
jgi:hypothetical protein